MKRFAVFWLFLAALGGLALFAQTAETGEAENPAAAQDSGIDFDGESAAVSADTDDDGFGFDGESGFNDDAFGFEDEERPWSLASALKARGEVSGRLLFWDRIFSGDEDFDFEEAIDV
jgi:hypothetical protein